MTEWLFIHNQNERNSMYQDWKQWARFAYSAFNLFIVWQLTQPWAISLYSEWETAGYIQVSLFVIAAGLVFPLKRRFEWDDDGDVFQLRVGVFVSWIAWAASFLP
jgi:hypothetical protein